MYSINGIPLHDPARGWREKRAGTQTQGGITNQLTKTPSPGRGGYSPTPTTFTEQIIVFTVRCKREALDSLLALCASAKILTRTADPTKEARVELASAIPSGDAPFDGMFDVTITLSAYEGFWRDVDAVIAGPTTITNPIQTVTMLPDLSAPIFDMDVFVRGVFNQFVLADSNGSILKTTRTWPGTAGTGLLFVGATQQAFVANAASPWNPVSDASQYIDVSGHGGFRLTPELVGGDPDVRRVSLSLTTLAQTSVTLTVRAKRSYRMN